MAVKTALSPRIVRRETDEDQLLEAHRAGLPPILAHIVASRIPRSAPDLNKLLSPTLSMLDSPYGLPDIESAAHRLALAVTQRELCAYVHDYDNDGSQAYCVLYEAMTRCFGHPKELISQHISHRVLEGYGLCDPVADRILAMVPLPTVVVTMDCGSSDEPRIKRLSDAGISVLVLDHHILDEPPKSAYACVTPQRSDSTYPDDKICGAFVTWLVANVTRRVLMDIEHLPANTPHLGGLCEFVGVASIADCMNLATSVNNRAVILAGLERINQQRRPCWKVAVSMLAKGGKLNEKHVSHYLSPMINAVGRLETAHAAVSFMLSETVDEAMKWWKVLDDSNLERREIQKRMMIEANATADRLVAAGARRGLAIAFKDGHTGVQGICAQRIVERHGLPTVCFSKKPGKEAIMAGSARSSHGVDIYEAFKWIKAKAPALVKKAGGHKAAAGIELAGEPEVVERFATLLDQAITAQVKNRVLGPVIETDGSLPPEYRTLETVALFDQLRPYGKNFESPVYDDVVAVVDVKEMGDGTHLRLTVEDSCGTRAEAVWFGAKEAKAEIPVAPGEVVRMIYSPEANSYRGKTRLQLSVKAILNSKSAA